MKIRELFDPDSTNHVDRTVYSFEVFPPKRTMPIESVYGKLEDICGLKPDFISVTYGAGGTGADNGTVQIASRIKNVYGIESAAHLTCIRNNRDDVDATVQVLRENHIENILALRGDRVPDEEPKTDFAHASDLTRYLTQNTEFDIAGACYPESHPESGSAVEDIRHLKEKVDAGCTHLISQLFFDNEMFYSFRERAELAGINVPIEAGIMPVTNVKQITRMVTLCGASLPPKFARVMTKYADKPDSLREAGIAYAIDQIIDLIAAGVDGIHLYTMNNPYIAKKISDAVVPLL